MKKIIANENNNIENSSNNDNVVTKKPKKTGFLHYLRTSIICFLILSVICGILYPVGVTIVSSTLFPYESNGSVITITDKNGNKRVYGSELIGQSYIVFDTNGEPKKNPDGTIMYRADLLIGRNDSGVPSNLSITSDAYKETTEERKKALENIGFTLDYSNLQGYSGIPGDIITSSASGCDPEISYSAAIYQASNIANYRLTQGMSTYTTKEEVVNLINKYTKNKFLLIFGTKRVNVLYVNLALEGLI